MSRNSDTRFTVALVAALFAVVTNASPLEPGEIIRRAVKATSRTNAEFVQRFTPKGFSAEQVEKGTILFGDLPKMRWVYSEPERKVFVFDGATSWFFSPEDEQLTIHRLTKGERMDLPLVVLSDPELGLSNYEVDRRSSASGLVTLELTPRGTDGAIRRFAVSVGPDSDRIIRLEWSDREGNRTVFEFSEYGNATPLEDSFRFDPPPGVDVIQN